MRVFSRELVWGSFDLSLVRDWYCSGYGFERLHAASEEINYELGQGLPGLAWPKRQPLQLDDIRDSGRFDRAVAAQRAGSGRPWPCP